MRKMSKMMYVNEGHEISIIPSPNGKQKRVCNNRML